MQIIFAPDSLAPLTLLSPRLPGANLADILQYGGRALFFIFNFYNMVAIFKSECKLNICQNEFARKILHFYSMAATALF